MNLNVALVPSPELAENLMHASRELTARYPTYFVLDGIHTHPHITLYATSFAKTALPRVKEAITGIAAATNPLTCTTTAMEAHQGYVGIALAKTTALQELHVKLVQTLSPLRAPVEAVPQDGYAMEFTPRQRANIVDYGYADAMDLYTPHATITRFNDTTTAEKVRAALTWDVTASTASKLALFTSDEHGTCTGIVQEYILQDR